MGSLARYLQDQFMAHCPAGWSCAVEQSLLSEELSDLLGYQSRSDVRLSKLDGSRHLWVEFEISRADPVANHAKYGTANIFGPMGPEHALVSMISSHVTRGRSNLAAASVYLLRRAGVQAFQTALYPHLSAGEVKAFNGQRPEFLHAESRLAVSPEIERAIAISSPLIQRYSHRIFFASNALEVILTARRWNAQVQDPRNREIWGRRTVTYFVFDPSSAAFAPSKFCAFIPAALLDQRDVRGSRGASGVELIEIADYAELDESESRFDGHLARNHLVRRLGFREVDLSDAGQSMHAALNRWLASRADVIRVHKRGARILLAP